MATKKMTRNEWAWVLMTLMHLKKKMPPHARHKIGYNATSWDLDDLYSRARDDATSHSSLIWQAIESKAVDGKWPKLPPATAFWLSQRVQQAYDFSQLVLAQGNDTKDVPLATPPSDGQLAIKKLLLDDWNEFLVDHWLAENLGSYTYQDSYGLDEESERYYNIWLNDLSDGKYIPSAE